MSNVAGLTAKQKRAAFHQFDDCTPARIPLATEDEYEEFYSGTLEHVVVAGQLSTGQAVPRNPDSAPKVKRFTTFEQFSQQTWSKQSLHARLSSVPPVHLLEQPGLVQIDANDGLSFPSPRSFDSLRFFLSYFRRAFKGGRTTCQETQS